MQTCPICVGAKNVAQRIQPGDWRKVWIECSVCKGTGQVTREHLRAIRIGRLEAERESTRRSDMTKQEIDDLKMGRV